MLSTLALGLFISTISDTQQQAMMTSTFFFLTPMIYLSGFIFPIENMPAIIQQATYLIPLRYFLVIVRGIFLKGIGLDLLWPQALALAGWGTGMLALAVAAQPQARGLKAEGRRGGDGEDGDTGSQTEQRSQRGQRTSLLRSLRRARAVLRWCRGPQGRGRWGESRTRHKRHLTSSRLCLVRLSPRRSALRALTISKPSRSSLAFINVQVERPPVK